MAGSRPTAARRPSGRRGFVLAATAAATIAGTIAGCGDDDKSSKADSGLSRAELKQQADPICKRHHETTAAAANKVLAGGRLPDPRQFGRLAMQTIIPEYKAQIAELRALKPADDMAAEYEAWLDESDATAARMQKDPSLITDGKSFVDVNAQADDLGLAKQCHAGPTS